MLVRFVKALSLMLCVGMLWGSVPAQAQYGGDDCGVSLERRSGDIGDYRRGSHRQRRDDLGGAYNRQQRGGDFRGSSESAGRDSRLERSGERGSSHVHRLPKAHRRR